jgi:hypothetical protein
MFRFCKINLFDKNITDWVLEIKDVSTYKLWNEKFHTAYFKKGSDNIIKRKQTWDKEKIYQAKKYPGEKFYPTKGHWNSDIAMLSEIAGGDETETDLIDGFEKVTNDYITSKYNAILRGDTIYCYEGCQWFTLVPGCKIVEEILKEDLVYPHTKYTEKDIKVVKWPGGKHYYARIGEIDVTDDENNLKWNSYQTAYNKAVEQLNKINLT